MRIINPFRCWNWPRRSHHSAFAPSPGAKACLNHCAHALPEYGYAPPTAISHVKRNGSSSNGLKAAAEPTRYWMSTHPKRITFAELVESIKARWRIERDYQEFKQEFGLGHYEGRNWRGFHHHASLCIAAYGFLMRERLSGAKKNGDQSKESALPEDFRPRGAGPDATARAGLDLHITLSPGARHLPGLATVPMLRASTRQSYEILITQRTTTPAIPTISKNASVNILPVSAAATRYPGYR